MSAPRIVCVWQAGAALVCGRDHHLHKLVWPRSVEHGCACAGRLQAVAPVARRSCAGRLPVGRRLFAGHAVSAVARLLAGVCIGRFAGWLPVVVCGCSRPVVWPGRSSGRLFGRSCGRPFGRSCGRPFGRPALLAVLSAVRRTLAGRPSAVRQPVCRPCVGRESVRGAGRSPAVSRSLLPVARRPVSDIRRPFAGCAPVVRRVSVLLSLG